MPTGPAPGRPRSGAENDDGIPTICQNLKRKEKRQINENEDLTRDMCPLLTIAKKAQTRCSFERCAWYIRPGDAGIGGSPMTPGCACVSIAHAAKDLAAIMNEAKCVTGVAPR